MNFLIPYECYRNDRLRNAKRSFLLFMDIEQTLLMEFHLRPWTDNDLPSLVKHADNFKIARMLTNQFPHPYSEEAGKSFLKNTRAFHPPRILAIDVNGEAVGAIGLHAQTDIQCKNAEMGYWLSEEYWGKGIMSRAIPKMVDYGFKNLDVDRIYARPFGHNVGSQKALEKAGFQLEAKFEKTLFKNNEYVDELYYGLRKENWR